MKRVVLESCNEEISTECDQWREVDVTWEAVTRGSGASGDAGDNVKGFLEEKVLNGEWVW